MNNSISTDLRTPEMIATAQRAFIVKVYAWMTLGLCLTAAAALYTISNENLLQAIVSDRWLFMGLLVVELGLVWILSASIAKLTVTTASVGFIGYAALNGVTLSIVLLAYTGSSVAQVFIITAGTFGLMCAFGYLTKRDLTAWGNLLFMALLGLLLAMLVNLLLRSETMSWLLSAVGVLIFVGLTAYDTQKLKKLGAAVDQSSDAGQKAAIIGALALYLDFINLFLMLLRLFGRRR
jgi:uncharacterized protein